MSRCASRSGVQVGGALPIVPQLQCMRVCGRGCTNSANNYSQEKLFVHALGKTANGLANTISNSRRNSRTRTRRFFVLAFTIS